MLLAFVLCYNRSACIARVFLQQNSSSSRSVEIDRSPAKGFVAARTDKCGGVFTALAIRLGGPQHTSQIITSEEKRCRLRTCGGSIFNGVRAPDSAQALFGAHTNILFSIAQGRLGDV